MIDVITSILWNCYRMLFYYLKIVTYNFIISQSIGLGSKDWFCQLI